MTEKHENPHWFFNDDEKVIKKLQHLDEDIEKGKRKVFTEAEMLEKYPFLKDEQPFAIRHAELLQKQRSLDISRRFYNADAIFALVTLACGLLVIGIGCGQFTVSGQTFLTQKWYAISALIVGFLAVITGAVLVLWSGWSFREVFIKRKDYETDLNKTNADRLALFGHENFWTDSIEGKKIR